MKDEDKSREQLLTELCQLRQQVTKLKKSKTERKLAEEAPQRNIETAQQLSKENEVIAEIGRIISSSLNIEEVYERFADEVKKNISFARITINLINPEDPTASWARRASTT